MRLFILIAFLVIAFLNNVSASDISNSKKARAFNLVDQACGLYEQDIDSCLRDFESHYQFDIGAGIKGLVEACEGGTNPRACYFAGKVQDVFEPEKNTLENSPAFLNYLTACENGFLLGCTFVYERYTHLDDPDLQIQAQIRLKKNCYKGEISSCRMLGAGLSNERWEAIYNLRAMSAAFNQDCISGNKYACSILGYQTNTNFSLEDNAKIQVDMLSKTCGASVTYDCVTLGNKYFSGENIEADLEKALSAFQQGCSHQDKLSARACDKLGAVSMSNINNENALQNAQNAWRSACYGGLFGDCLLLETQLQAKGLQGFDLIDSAANFIESCNGGNAQACYLAGSIYSFEDQAAPKRDIEAAKGYFAKGCDLNFPFACTSHAALLYETETVDIESAESLLEKGCNLGDPNACKSRARPIYFIVISEDSATN